MAMAESQVMRLSEIGEGEVRQASTRRAERVEPLVSQGFRTVNLATEGQQVSR
jgi:hypothetical protein